MFAGHIGAALAIGRCAPGVNVGRFVIAALLFDIVLWALILAGWEGVAIPPDFATHRQPRFDFPYSHGLVGAILWSAAAGVVLGWSSGSRASRAVIAGLLAATAFSHWLLDALVHQPEMPVFGPGSAMVGLHLWSHLTLALTVEAALVVGGLVLYLRAAALSRGRTASLAVLALVTLALTVVGMTVAPPPPSATAMAATSLATVVLVCGLAWWCGRRPA